MEDPQLISQTQEQVQDFLTQLGLDSEIEVTIEAEERSDGEEHYLKIHLKGENLAELIGHRGRTLESIQTIFGLMINRDREDRIRVFLEVNDYRESRIKYLKSFALRAADDVRSSGQEMSLEPMKPSERRIVHMVLEQEDGIVTESIGEGRDRRIVIKLKIK